MLTTSARPNRSYICYKSQAMENQYCRVGATSRVATGEQGVEWLEHQYRHFVQKAAETQQGEARLRDFFEHKARQLQQMLQNLVNP